MPWRHPIAAAIIGALTLCLAPSEGRAQAGTPTAGRSGWTFTLTPYAWIAGLKGDVGTLSGFPPAEVDVSFSDIIQSTEIAAMLAGEARRGRWGLLLDLVYLDLSEDAEGPEPFFGEAELQSTTLFATLSGAYRVLEKERVALDVLAGMRPWYLDTKLELSAGLLAARSTSDTEGWVDPLVGARVSFALGGGFSVTGVADVGGFGVGSDISWQAIATLNYRLRDWLWLRAGYRHLEVDYEDGGFVYDVQMSGPILGAGLQF